MDLIFGVFLLLIRKWAMKMMIAFKAAYKMLEETLTNRICTTCNKDFQNTPGTKDFLTDGLCDTCADKLKAGIKQMEIVESQLQSDNVLLLNYVITSRGTSSDGMDI